MTQPRISLKERLRYQRLYADLFADSFEYTEEHVAFLKRRRDDYLKSLRA